MNGQVLLSILVLIRGSRQYRYVELVIVYIHLAVPSLGKLLYYNNLAKIMETHVFPIKGEANQEASVATYLCNRVSHPGFRERSLEAP